MITIVDVEHDGFVGCQFGQNVFQDRYGGDVVCTENGFTFAETQNLIELGCITV